MAQRIDIQGVGVVEFPDDMSDADITRAIETEILPQSKFGGGGGMQTGVGGQWSEPGPIAKAIGGGIERFTRGVEAITPVDPVTLAGRIVGSPEGAEALAGMGAGVLAGARSTPVAMAATGLAGAGVEAFRQIGQQALGSPGAPSTSLEAFGRIAGAAGRQAIPEFAGRKIVAPLAKMFVKKVTPAAKEAVEWMRTKADELAQSADVAPELAASAQEVAARPLTPDEMTESRLLDLARNVTEYSFFGGGMIRRAKIRVADVMRRVTDGVAERFGELADPADIGLLWDQTVKGKLRADRTVENQLYTEIGELTKPDSITRTVTEYTAPPWGGPMNVTTREVTEEVLTVPVDLRPLKAKAAAHLQKARRAGGIDSKRQGDALARSIAAQPDVINADAAMELLKRLRSVQDDPGLVKAPGKGLATGLHSLLRKQLLPALDQHAPKAAELYKQATSRVLQSRRELNNAFMRKVTKLADPIYGPGTPEVIVNKVFASPTNIARARHTLGEKMWTKMQRWRVQSWLDDPSLVKDTGYGAELQGERLLAKFLTPHGNVQPWARAAFTGEQLRELKNLGNALRHTQMHPVEGTGRAAIQFIQPTVAVRLISQVGTAGFLAYGGYEKEAAFVLLGPAIVARLLVNPAAARALTEGLKHPFSTAQGSAAAMRVLTAAARAALPDATTDPENAGLLPGLQMGSPPTRPPSPTPAPPPSDPVAALRSRLRMHNFPPRPGGLAGGLPLGPPAR